MSSAAQKTALVGYLLALGAAMGYGGSQVVAKQIVEETHSLVGAAFSLLFGLTLLSMLTARDVAQQGRVQAKAYVWALLAGLASAGGVVFLYLALGQAPVVVVAPVTGTNPLFSIILAWVFLRRMERLTPRIVLGAVLVLAGVTVVSVSQAGQG